jgi:cob(I)alamin adenosyltransferase
MSPFYEKPGTFFDVPKEYTESSMSIVTKTGDDGTTGLYGNIRVPKDHPRMETIGTVDELNALIGCVLAEAESPELTRIQHLLFILGADLATPIDSFQEMVRISAEHIAELEKWIGETEPTLPRLQWFILPGGSKAGALLHHARTVCRRAERCLVSLRAKEPVNPHIGIFLNRLSDLLFILARQTNIQNNKEEVRVDYN